MRRAGLTGLLAVLCVPVLLAAAALGPLAAMEQADRDRLDAVHPLVSPDIGAPSPEAMEIPLVAWLYQLALMQDPDDYSPYTLDEEIQLNCSKKDIRKPMEKLAPALPDGWTDLLEQMELRAARVIPVGYALHKAFSSLELRFYDQDVFTPFGTLTVVTAPDKVTPVQMNLFVNGFYDLEITPALDDPYGVLEDITLVLGLEELDWEPVQLASSDSYWCIRSNQANLRLVVHAQTYEPDGSYSLSITLTMMPPE